jgi:hypothetical protein
MGNIGFECGGDKWPSRSNSIHDEILACYGLIQQSGIAGIPYEEANRRRQVRLRRMMRDSCHDVAARYRLSHELATSFACRTHDQNAH